MAEHPRALPPMAREIHRLLRRAGAFDRHRRLGEERAAAAEPAHEPVGIGRQVVAIVGGDAAAAERRCQAGDRLPVELEPRADDERAVADHAPVGERDPVVRGIEGRGGGADPFGARRNQPSLAAPRDLGGENTAADHRPARLVIMILARLDDRERHVRAAPQDARGGSYPRAAAADHENVVARNPAAFAARRSHRRELLRARARAAIGKHRTRQFGERACHRGGIALVNHARYDRDVKETDALRLGRRRDRSRRRLARLFAVGTGADDRAETRGRERGHVRRVDLRRHAERRGQGPDGHNLSVRERAPALKAGRPVS